LQLLVAAQESVRLINQECGREILDHAKERGRTDVGSGDRAMGQFVEDGQEGGLAALLLWRFDADVGTHVAQFESVGVQDPQSQSFWCPRGKDDKTLQNDD